MPLQTFLKLDAWYESTKGLKLKEGEMKSKGGDGNR